MDRILEEDLQLPALYLIEQDNGKITTSELSQKLRTLLKPQGEDLEILHGRSDDKFSQIVRNLTGTGRPFVKNGFISRESGRNKPISITEKGKKLLHDNFEVVNYLLVNNFHFNDIIESFKKVSTADKTSEIFKETMTIDEGSYSTKTTNVYKRSAQLREKAIEFYTVNGRVKCKACCFDFEDFYGEYGEKFIEIHHQKPVFQFDGDDLEQTIQNALENVVPVCSNCHRMIHRKRDNPISVDKLKTFINESLGFCHKQ
jgi:hypothetical protein